MKTNTLTLKVLHQVDAYWRAANYLSVGQIYLYDNPLLKQPLTLAHIKPRLLGHWGTTPGLNFIYVHLNRVIKEHDLDAIYITGPGHGGPGLVANAYLEGTYTEVYPNITQDTEGMKLLFKQCSFPGGIPSHVAPETPGSIHEGGELGYSLSHAFGAAFDNPDLRWRTGEILIRGKGSRQDLLPLPSDVGAAIARYLRLDRGAWPTRRVFVRTIAPRVPLAGPASIGHMVRRAMAKAGVNRPNRIAAHLFRHYADLRTMPTGTKARSLAELSDGAFVNLKPP